VLLTGRRRSFPLCIADWSGARVHDSRLQQSFADQAARARVRRSDPIDDRTDVFSIGVIAYRLLTGRLPFDQGILADRPSAGEVRAELSWTADAPATPIHSRPPAAGQLRIRRPRWTPNLEFEERAKTGVFENALTQISDDD